MTTAASNDHEIRLHTLREVHAALVEKFGEDDHAARYLAEITAAAERAHGTRLQAAQGTAHADATRAASRPRTATGPVLVGPIVVACDGSSLSNPGHAGWCWYVDGDRWAADSKTHATNNEMELTAVLRFLEATAGALDDVDTVIRCDSKYVIDGVTKWSTGWAKKGWRTASGGPVANKELFQAILTLLAPRTATRFEWVKGHAGDAQNTAADQRAWGAASASQNGRTADIGPGWDSP